MTTLAEQQRQFLNAVLDADQPVPAGWTERHAAGLAIYRNNYRATLIEAMRATFARTARLVGSDAFHQAAAHHLIAHPPTGWTLDDVGAGFDRTCAELFRDDAEVAELAWLEWAMHRAFTARTMPALTGPGFAAACADFAEEDWAALGLVFAPAVAVMPVRHDLTALWPSLAHDDRPPAIVVLDAPRHALVWRDGEEPVFALVDADEGRALSALLDGARWGDACTRLAAAIGDAAASIEAGRMLRDWIDRGLVSGVAA